MSRFECVAQPPRARCSRRRPAAFSPCETDAARRARARRGRDARSGGRSPFAPTDRGCSRVLRRETVPVATQPAGLCSVASPTVLSDTPGRSIGRDSFVIDTSYDQDVSRPGRRPRWPRRRGDDRASPAPAAARLFCAFVRALQRAAPSSPLSVCADVRRADLAAVCAQRSAPAARCAPAAAAASRAASPSRAASGRSSSATRPSARSTGTS